VIARLLECAGAGGAAELRFARDPKRAQLLDARGSLVLEVEPQADAVPLDLADHDLMHVRVEFS
jgi:hypothetical protein